MELSIYNISELMLLLIPGYVTVEIIHRYGTNYKRNKFDTVLYSILYSFIIYILYSIIAYICGMLLSSGVSEFFSNYTSQVAICLILGVLLAYSIIKVVPTHFGNSILHIFNKNLSTKRSPWTEAMKNENGAWATVYMKNGLIYTGKLIFYTDNLDVDNKELLLISYRTAVQTGNTDDPKNYCLVITDYTNNDNAKVFLQLNNIISIEVIP